MAEALKCPLRIMIVSPFVLSRAAWRALLAARPDVQVVGEAADTQEALNVAASENPNLILLDADECTEDLLNALPRLVKAAQDAHSIFLTGEREASQYRRAVKIGANGVFWKGHPPELFFKALEKVCAGEVWLDRTLIANLLAEMARTPAPETLSPQAQKISTLTAREREVVVLIGEGLRNKQIAERLAISEVTVRHHLTAIFSKLDLGDRLELMIFAYQHGLAKPPQ